MKPQKVILECSLSSNLINVQINKYLERLYLLLLEAGTT